MQQNSRYSYETTPGSPSKIRQRGLFDDGVWKCDCVPRKPAVHFQTKNGGKNHGRWFYTCQESVRSRCGFFLWDDDAKPREKAAVLSNSRTEPHDGVAESLRVHHAAMAAAAEEEESKRQHRMRRYSERDRHGQHHEENQEEDEPWLTLPANDAVDTKTNTKVARSLFTGKKSRNGRDTPDSGVYEWSSSSGDEAPGGRKATFHDARELPGSSERKPSRKSSSKKEKRASHPHIIYEDDTTDSDDADSPRKASRTAVSSSPGKRGRRKSEIDKDMDGLSYYGHDGRVHQFGRGVSPSPAARRSTTRKNGAAMPDGDQATTFKKPVRQAVATEAPVSALGPGSARRDPRQASNASPYAADVTPTNAGRFYDALSTPTLQETPTLGASRMLGQVTLNSGGDTRRHERRTEPAQLQHAQYKHAANFPNVPDDQEDDALLTAAADAAQSRSTGTPRANTSFGTTDSPAAASSMLTRLTSDIFGVLDASGTRLSRDVEKRLREHCERHARVALGFEAGRDVTRQALRDRELEIMRLREEMRRLEADLDLARRAGRMGRGSRGDDHGDEDGDGRDGRDGRGDGSRRRRSNPGARVSFEGVSSGSTVKNSGVAPPPPVDGGKSPKAPPRRGARRQSVADMIKAQSQRTKEQKEQEEEDNHSATTETTPTESSEDEDE